MKLILVECKVIDVWIYSSKRELNYFNYVWTQKLQIIASFKLEYSLEINSILLNSIQRCQNKFCNPKLTLCMFDFNFKETKINFGIVKLIFAYVWIMSS